MNWKTAVLILIALVAGLGVLGKMAIRTPQAPAHQVFINGSIITMDVNNPVVEALSTRKERIEKVGSTAEIMALVGDDTEVVDLHGRTMLPGFIDAHGHFPGSGLSVIAADLNSPPIGSNLAIEDVLAALTEQAAKTPAGEWVSGFGYDDTLLAEKRHPTREELDSVSSEHPVVAMHVSGHMVVANSVALERVGISADTPDPEGGVIGRMPGSQEPNGLLEETARLEIMRELQDMSLVDTYRLIKSATNEYSAMGVTTAQSGGVSPELALGLSLFSKLGVIQQRLILFPFETEWEEMLFNGEYDPDKYNADKVTMGAVKLIADGSIQGYTGYLSEPYYTPYHGDANYRGYPTVSREELFEQVEALHKAGYQLAIHGNGDASIEDILDAFEAAQKAHPVDDPRMILIHAQMARKDQIARMKALGVTPSFFTAHTWYWGDRHRDIFMGPQRAAQISPSKWALDHGLHFSSHLDTPVTPMAPLQAVWSQVFRITTGGEVLGPEQRIGVMEALRAVTIDAAWQVFQEDNRGSLNPGKYADLVVLSGNLLDDPMAMRDLKVDRTIIGGATVYNGE
ncbi:N-substituted formamide deformylase [Halioglobus japonicus]|nr:N-substituted formamide deformylase [Halioglobus japonicus]